MKRLKLIYHFDDWPEEESDTLEVDSDSNFYLSRKGKPETRKKISLLQACEMIQRSYRMCKGSQGDPESLMKIIIRRLKAHNRAMRKTRRAAMLAVSAALKFGRRHGQPKAASKMEGKVPITVCGLTVYVRPSVYRFIRQTARAQKIPMKRMAAKLFRKQLETVA